MRLRPPIGGLGLLMLNLLLHFAHGRPRAPGQPPRAFSVFCSRVGVHAWTLLAMASSGCELVLGDIPPDVLEQLDSGFDDLDEDELWFDASPAKPQHFEPEEPAAEVTPEAAQSDAPGNPALPRDDGCNKLWYLDHDGDGYGAGPAQLACQPPEHDWVDRAGDCADADALVFPGQKAFFDKAYLRADGVDSFDYDCSGTEQGNPSQALAPRCEMVRGPQCGAAGYTETPRGAKGVNPFCGSFVMEVCQSTLAVVFCKSSLQAVNTPYACR
jgi:hypothetical protein